ncbi:hypothetical protein GGQ64_003244 [Rhizobium azooxidifex]|jgi:hypothetical protein|uniref:Uncharacterized protein n=1 Tax=Mycoplana azooxidifex TaxID=1636188 RepID=A0A7W6DC66_9HYPH|nr:hypothetical protein [Mycoplana azooxidifex]MBB3978030.1 hypothetical protein [Mycoplana azooxidifex]
MIESSDIEVEDERLKLITELAQARGTTSAELLARSAPGTRSCHEATHTASIVLDLVDQHLLHHPAIAANPEWFRYASRASEALFNLYQSMGEAQLEHHGDDGLRPEELNASNDD